MKSFVFTLAAFAAGSNALVGRSDSCCFGLTASGGASGALGQLSDGQNRIGDNSLPPAHYCIDSTGSITDGSRRGCILTPPTTQFQCDEGATPTPGFSVSPSGQLQFQGSPSFIACETGQNGGLNIYTTNSSAVTQCKSIQLMADSCFGSGAGASSSAVASSTPVSTAAASSTPVISSPAARSSTHAGSAPAGGSTSAAGTVPASGTAPASTAPASTAPAGSTPAGTAPAGTAPAGTALGSAPAGTAPAGTAPAGTAPAGTAPGTAPAATAPAGSAPAGTAPGTAPTGSASGTVPAGACPPTGSPVTVISTVTVTECPCPATSAPTGLAPSGSSAPGAPAPSSSAPAPIRSSTPGGSVPAPSGSAPAPSSRPTSASVSPTSVPVTSGGVSPSSSAGRPSGMTSVPASSTAVAPSGTSPPPGSCPTTLTTPIGGNFEFPHLIIPLNSGSPDTAYGTQFNGTVNSTVSTIFNFDVSSSHAGKTCHLVFLFPHLADLETSSFSFSGNGKIDVAQLSSPASSSTTYNNAPSVMKNLGDITVSPGNNYVISTFSCPAGQTVAYEMKNAGTTDLNYFEDFNPSPIGLFMTVC